MPRNGADLLSAFLIALNNYTQSRPGIAVIVTRASSKDAFAKQTEALSQKLNEIVGTNKYTKPANKKSSINFKIAKEIKE